MKRVLRWVLWLALIFLVYAIFYSPEQAADIIVDAIQGIGRAVGAVFAFFNAVLAELGNDTVAPPG